MRARYRGWQVGEQSVEEGSLSVFIPIPQERQGIWSTRSLTVDDQGSVQELELTSKYGTLRFGQDTRDGHVGWRFEHTGGSITLPYARRDGRLYVGLLPEKRVNLGGWAYPCAIGGFRRPDESHAAAASRETLAETKASAPDPLLLPGLSGAIDRNYFEVNVAAGEGLKAYAVQVPADELEFSPENGLRLTHASWKGVEFLPWQDAIVATPDVIARAGIAQLLVHLGIG